MANILLTRDPNNQETKFNNSKRCMMVETIVIEDKIPKEPDQVSIETRQLADARAPVLNSNDHEKVIGVAKIYLECHKIQ